MSKIPGGPTPAGAAVMRAGAKEGAVGTSKRYHWQQDINGPNANVEFPIVPVGPDPYDDVANIKDQYAYLGSAAGGNKSNWVVPFEQADAQYLMRKRDQEEKAQFDMWVTQKFNLTDPAQNMMLQSIAPELFQRREEVIDTQQNLVSRYAKMRLRGAKNIEDLYLEWLIETGRIDLPKGPIWDPKAWRKAQFNNAGGDPSVDRQANRGRYYAGFFSPLKWMGGNTDGIRQMGNQANTANYFDVTGTNQVYRNNVAGAPYFSDASVNMYGDRYANVYMPPPQPARAANNQGFAGNFAGVPSNH